MHENLNPTAGQRRETALGQPAVLKAAARERNGLRLNTDGNFNHGGDESAVKTTCNHFMRTTVAHIRDNRTNQW